MRPASFAIALLACSCGAPAAAPRTEGAALPTPTEIAQQLAEVRLLGLYCRMPPGARVEQQVHRDSDGAFARTVSAHTSGTLGSYRIIVTEWEQGMVGDPLQAARALADGVFSTQDLHERRSGRVDVPGFYARQDAGLAANGIFMVLRQYVGRGRIYLALATIAQAPLQVRVAEAFMDSITLDPEDALLPLPGQSSGSASLIFVPEADFAVRMPALTEESRGEVELGGQRLPAVSYVSGTQLRLRVLTLPAEAMEGDVLEQAIAALSLGTAGDPVQASGFPGVTFVRESGGATVRGRAFLTGQRIYVLEATSTAAAHDDSVARDFFESFRILA